MQILKAIDSLFQIFCNIDFARETNAPVADDLLAEFLYLYMKQAN